MNTEEKQKALDLLVHLTASALEIQDIALHFAKTGQWITEDKQKRESVQGVIEVCIMANAEAHYDDLPRVIKANIGKYISNTHIAANLINDDIDEDGMENIAAIVHKCLSFAKSGE